MNPGTSDDGLVLLLTSLPAKTFVGLDLLSFNSSPNFKGFSNIPHGLHYIYTGTDASLSIRHGRWLLLTPAVPAVSDLKWNANTENLDVVVVDNDVQNTVVPRSKSRNPGLVDYTALQDATSDLAAREADSNNGGASSSQSQRPLAAEDEEGENADRRAESTDWPSLTSHISPSLLTRILSSEWVVSSISSAPNDTETIPGLSHLGDQASATNVLHQLPLNLLPIDLKQTWADGDIGRTRTDRARDRSWYLGQLISRAGDGQTDTNGGARAVLGELQFCFLMVLTLANYSCLEQWKRLLSVFLTCRTAALGEAQAYFVEMLKTLHLQMRHVEDVEGGLFELRDEMASSWLRALWGRFRALVVDDDDDGDGDGTAGGAGARAGEALKREVNALQAFFEKRYGWQSERDILRRGMLELEDGEQVEVSMEGVDEDEETGEYAPVVVEM